MIEILDMADSDSEELLARVGYGHFACSSADQPYVVPIHYAYNKPDIYVYTTDGKKAEIIRSNPKVCLQVEDVVNDELWQSVIVIGEAEQIMEKDERDEAIRVILAANPDLMPANSIRWVNNWVRENIEVIYRIKAASITGRSAVQVVSSAAFANRRSRIF